MKIAAFISHPIQYFTPLWSELSLRPGVDLVVHYFSRCGLDPAIDPQFGVSVAWDIDLLRGHKYQFLPRQWPTTDPLDSSPNALNRELWRALRPGWDVVYISGYSHLNNWAILAMCRVLGIPVMCFGDTNMSWQVAKSRRRLAAKKIALSVIFPQISAFLAVGGQARTYFARSGAPEQSIFICPYSVDVERFRKTVALGGEEKLMKLRSEWGIPPSKRIVMFCGKLYAGKRPLDLVHALRKLGRDDTIGVFVGDGQMRHAVEQEGGDQVVVTGFVNQSQIPLALALADVLVLCSEFEGYGIVVSEAQCLGVPAIVSEACGCHGLDSVLQNEVSGFVFPTGDVDALAERLEQLLTDDALYARMRQAARRQGETQSQVSAADGFMAAVEYCLGSHRSREAV